MTLIGGWQLYDSGAHVIVVGEAQALETVPHRCPLLYYNRQRLVNRLSFMLKSRAHSGCDRAPIHGCCGTAGYEL